MKRIIATAPTNYQLSSLAAFNLLGKTLTRFEDSNGSPEILSDMLERIDKHRFLTLDGVTASITDIED